MSEDISKRAAQAKSAPLGVGKAEDWHQGCDIRLLDITPAATLLVDGFGRILRANRRAYEILDPPDNILTGTRIHDRLRADSAEAFGLFFASICDSFEIHTCEMRFESASSEVIDMLVQARSVAQEDGQFLVISLSDISAWRSADPEIILIEERLRHSQKMEALGRLSAGVIHDFNNILTVVAGYSRILLDDLDVSVQRQYVQKIAHASGRAADLVSKMLTFGRGEEDVAAERVLNLNDRVIAFEDMFRGIVSDEVELRALLEPSLSNIRVNANQIDQILMNLALNARDAMGDAGVLSFETSSRYIGSDRPPHLAHLTTGPYVELTVCDTGSGMTPEVAARAFRPFFSTKGVGRGTGLGLATVRSIMHACGGEVELTTTPQNGSCFGLLFPCADSSVDPLSESFVGAMRSERGSTHILVVDKNLDVRELIVYVLEREGYYVSESSPADAFEKAQRATPPYTLVLMDKNVPKPLSNKLMIGLRAQQPAIKFLFLSGQGAQPAFEAGCGELQKPFTPHELSYAVQDLLDP